ncbi:MAG: hypothetical protein MMC33_000753 [Icmadophila ericetorum]|nr:hypothetical protein [Icmadophila ericetorum]
MSPDLATVEQNKNIPMALEFLWNSIAKHKGKPESKFVEEMKKPVAIEVKSTRVAVSEEVVTLQSPSKALAVTNLQPARVVPTFNLIMWNTDIDL